MKSDRLRELLPPLAPDLQRVLGWPAGPIQLTRGRCGLTMAGMCVDLEGWHLRGPGGRRRWLGRNLDEAAAELDRLVGEAPEVHTQLRERA